MSDQTATTGSVLVVDDERDMAESCAFFLARVGLKSAVAFSGEEALAKLAEQRFDLIVTDLKMPGMSGLTLLQEIKQRDPDIEVILVTAYPEVETAVEAMKLGASDYLTKPFDDSQLIERVEKALVQREIKERNTAFRDRVRQGKGGRKLVFRSEVFRRVLDTLERAARTDASVLIQGESGTGKELLAHYLHDASPRTDKPFVPVDCATMPENLIESELFGHVKGAFSGALGNKMGLFQVADGGTLFLDEIGELALPFQTKLLRVIQERRFRRVGGTDEISVDVRIVCATNRNLAKEVDAGRFRQDLFYRLDVVRVEAPPLRDRIEDVEVLAQHCLEEFVRDNPGCDRRGFSPEAMVALKGYEWPGNVRQLRNAVERACTMGSGDKVLVQHLSADVRKGGGMSDAAGTDEEGRALGSFQEMKARKLAAIETTYVADLLRRHEGNVTRSAEEAGMTRSAFQKLMQRYNIKSSEFRS